MEVFTERIQERASHFKILHYKIFLFLVAKILAIKCHLLITIKIKTYFLFRFTGILGLRITTIINYSEKNIILSYGNTLYWYLTITLNLSPLCWICKQISSSYFKTSSHLISLLLCWLQSWFTSPVHETIPSHDGDFNWENRNTRMILAQTNGDRQVWTFHYSECWL